MRIESSTRGITVEDFIRDVTKASEITGRALVRCTQVYAEKTAAIARCEAIVAK